MGGSHGPYTYYLAKPHDSRRNIALNFVAGGRQASTKEPRSTSVFGKQMLNSAGQYRFKSILLYYYAFAMTTVGEVLLVNFTLFSAELAGRMSRRLAIQALKALGHELCPSPPNCPRGTMLLPQDVKADVLKEMDEVAVCDRWAVRLCWGNELPLGRCPDATLFRF